MCAPSSNTWPLIEAHRFGEVWLLLEPSTAAELASEESSRPELRPVLLAEAVPRLRGRSEEMPCATLEVLVTFPTPRMIQ